MQHRLTMKQYRKLLQKQKPQSPRKSPLLKRQLKYGNRKTEYNGRQYDSSKEARRAAELDILKRAGEITAWFPQPEFRIEHRGVKICKYFADFKVEYPDGRIEYEDVKSEMTRKLAVYRLKKKLVRAFYGVEIKEI